MYSIHHIFRVGSLLAVTFTFDLLTPKFNQHIFESKYICDQNWAKSPSLIFEIWYWQGFRVPAVTLTFDP